MSFEGGCGGGTGALVTQWHRPGNAIRGQLRSSEFWCRVTDGLAVSEGGREGERASESSEYSNGLDWHWIFQTIPNSRWLRCFRRVRCSDVVSTLENIFNTFYIFLNTATGASPL